MLETTANRISYTGSGTTGPFSFPYYFLEDNDLTVIKVTIATGAESTLALTTDYTVSGAGDAAGGSVTLVSSLSSSYKLVILRDPDALQSAAYPRNDPFPSATHERVADKLTMLLQRVKELVTRSIRLSDGDTSGATLTVPIVRANKALIFDASGNLTVSADNYNDQAADAAASAATATTQAGIATTQASTATTQAGIATTKAAEAAASAAALPNAVTAGADKVIVTDGTGTGWLYKTAAQMLAFLGLGVANQASGVVVLDASSKLPAVDGSQLTSLPVQPGAVQGVAKNLKIVASGLTNTSAVITADQVATYDGTSFKNAASVSLTVNSAASGENGLDTGSLAGSTWYSVWVIMKSDGTTAGLLSASATAPTMPSGYTFKARVGWVRTDGTANKYLLQTLQYGRRVQYVVLGSSNVAVMPLMANGTAGTVGTTGATTWASVATGAFVPSTASKIHVVLQQNYNNGTAINLACAPNNQYSGIFTTNQPPIWQGSAGQQSVVSDMVLESTNIYWASAGAAGALQCLGWEDNL